jgi:hypothetical protein
MTMLPPAKKSELDRNLYNDLVYTPLIAHLVHRLSPKWNDELIPRNELFESMLITHEINNVYAHHIIKVLKRIGKSCQHPLLMSPIKTSELGDVFNREIDDIHTSHDWGQTFQNLPRIIHVIFVHPAGGLKEFDNNTPHAIRAAIARHQVALQPKGFEYRGPARLLEHGIGGFQGPSLDARMMG